MSGFAEVVAGLAEQLAAADSSLAGEVTRLRSRLQGPVRVALLGPAKSGKSTLLNALVRERLAATAAEEATQFVTTYSYDDRYRVEAVTEDGMRRDVGFHRDGGLTIDDAVDEDVVRIEVGWPATGLRHMTLIDTPGLDSIIIDQDDRTAEMLEGEEAVDAAIVLMRRLHASDADFLESFATGAFGSRVNAVAVLSRADEVAGSAPDAMARADAMAGRYEAEPRIAALCAAVVPVSGILAEAAALLTEAEYHELAELAARADVEELTVSVDRFAGVSEAATGLLRRLGMFGVRRAVEAITAGRVHSGADLADHCADLSGIERLRSTIDRHVAGRADALRARAALRRLQSLAASSPTGADVLRSLEAAEVSAPELVAIRLEALVFGGEAELNDEEVREAVAIAADLAADERDRDRLVAAVERWRTAAADPRGIPATAEARELVARLYEVRLSRLE